MAGVVVHGGEPVAGAEVELRGEIIQRAGRPPPRTRTDAAGRFDLGQRPAARFAVVARADGLAPGGAIVDLADPRRRSDRLRIVLRECATTRHGRVHDAGGQPIPGAVIAWVRGSLGLGEVALDGAGRFKICAPRSGVLAARAPGYGERFLGDHMPAGGWNVVLVPEARIEGTVVDPDGCPVAGARVRYWGIPPATATSAADGRFALQGLSAGSGRVVAEHGRRGQTQEESVTVRAGQVRQGVILRADPCRVVAGIVLEGERPVAGVRVAGARTQSDGSFVIECASTEAFDLRVAGYDTGGARLEAGTEPADDLVLRVRGRAVVEGRVTAAGAAVPGAIVTALEWAREPGSIDDFARPSTRADEEGRFGLAGLRPGGHVLEAWDPETGRRSAPARLAIETREVRRIDLALDRGGEVAGVVVDAGGEPVAGVRVSLSGGDRDIERAPWDERDGLSPAGAHTGAAGRFRLTGLAAGRYRLDVGADRLFPAGPWARPDAGEWPAVVLETGDSRVELRLVVRGRFDRRIAGAVVDAGEKPVAGARVQTFVDGLTLEARVAYTRADGRFLLEELPEGRFELTAAAPDGSEGRIETSAGDTSATIEVAAAEGAVEGEIAGASGECAITAELDWDPTLGKTRAVGGRFRLEGLPPGPIQLRARCGEREGIAAAEVRAGETARVSIALHDLATLDLHVKVYPGGEPAPAGLRCEIGEAAAVTGEGGVARFAAPPRGEVMVTCALGETVSGMSELRLTPGDAVADAHVIELPAGATPDPERLGAALVTATDALRVESVQEGGPAARAGLETGDLVTAIAGAPTAGARQLAAFAYLSLAPGRVELTVRRGGEELALRLP